MEDKKMYPEVDRESACMEGLKVQPTDWRGKSEILDFQAQQAEMEVAD